MDQRPNTPRKPDNDDDNDLTVSRVLRNVLIWVTILVSLVIVGLMMTGQQGQDWPVSYSKYVEIVKSGNVAEARITKTQLNQEWAMGVEQAIEAEAQAQAICMQTKDFERAYKAFVAKEKPVFEGD